MIPLRDNVAGHRLTPSTRCSWRPTSPCSCTRFRWPPSGRVRRALCDGAGAARPRPSAWRRAAGRPRPSVAAVHGTDLDVHPRRPGHSPATCSTCSSSARRSRSGRVRRITCVLPVERDRFGRRDGRDGAAFDGPGIGASGAIAGFLGAYSSSSIRAGNILTVFPVFLRLPAVLYLIVWFAAQLSPGTAAGTGGALAGRCGLVGARRRISVRRCRGTESRCAPPERRRGRSDDFSTGFAVAIFQPAADCISPPAAVFTVGMFKVLRYLRAF